MKHKLFHSVIFAAFMVVGANLISAQDNSAVDVRKFEVAADFTAITFDMGPTKMGLGGRFTYNVTRSFALEAAGYFFPEDCDFCGRQAGRTSEGLFGVKIGKRFHKWGIFGKARPGLISSSKGRFDFTTSGNSFTTITGTQFFIRQSRETSFALDVGGVLEFYPTKRIITRLDFGLPIIHYAQRTTTTPVFDPVSGTYHLGTAVIPGETRGSVQVIAGVGFRF
jgi:hypothetical protein